MGRPTTFTQAVADAIAARVADGEPLRRILRTTKGMPPWRTVFHWIEDRPEFAAQMEKARAMGYDAIAEEALEIADTPHVGITETDKVGKDGPYTEVRRGDMIEHRRLQVDTRLKLLAKWHWKKYGDKQHLEHTGTDGGPVQVNITGADVGVL